MKMRWLLALYLFVTLTLNGTVFGQSLTLGGVVFSLPENAPAVAYEFALDAGLYQGARAEGEENQLGNFSYGNGKFHLQQSGPPGYCPAGNSQSPGCVFDGKYQKSEVATRQLDAHCQEVSFPISKGTLTLKGLNVFSNVTALYAQTFCSEAGTWFMAGGTLVVELR